MPPCDTEIETCHRDRAVIPRGCRLPATTLERIEKRYRMPLGDNRARFLPRTADRFGRDDCGRGRR